MNVRSRRFSGILASLFAMFAWSHAGATVQDLMATDVTTRAFSLVWASNEPLTADAVTVRVFNSDNGQQAEEITDLVITVLSDATALTNGVVKVDVVGNVVPLSPDTLYFVTAHTDPAEGGTFVLPNSGALPIETARLTTKVSITNQAIVNELIVRDVGPEPAQGTLLVLSVRGLSQYRVTSFFGKQNLAAGEALVDLNNVFAQGTRESAEVVSGDVLEMTWFRGRHCDGLANHQLVNFRKTPVQTETPPITSLAQGEACFFADTTCDGAVNVLDFQRVLSALNESEGSCAFNADLNVAPTADSTINVLDFQAVLSRLGESEPFD